MKQVSPKKYNKKYFSIFRDIHNKNNDFDSITHIHRKLASLLNIKKNENVVDYGCGGGDLTFFLHRKFSCNIVGIDYSKDAIDICLKKKKQYFSKFRKINSIKFIHCNNDQLPKLINVSYVFLGDVIEHMYDAEIEQVLQKVISWKNKTNITILVHTDNNIYLRFVRPIIDLINVIVGKADFMRIHERNNWEMERHVNLTNPFELKIKMQKYGFHHVKTEYPEINRESIKMQLGKLEKVPLLADISELIVKNFTFLSPGFYAIYKTN